MEIAISLMGIALTVLAIVLAYIWRTNGRIIEGLRILQEGQKTMQAGQERIAKLTEGIAKLIEDAERRRAEDTKYLAELIARISRYSD